MLVRGECVSSHLSEVIYFCGCFGWCGFYSDLWLHYFFFSSRRRHTRSTRDWSSDVCSSDLFARAHFLLEPWPGENIAQEFIGLHQPIAVRDQHVVDANDVVVAQIGVIKFETAGDRKSVV